MVHGELSFLYIRPLESTAFEGQKQAAHDLPCYAAQNKTSS